jgi:uncharacterized FAD-dependent dehydrogenase
MNYDVIIIGAGASGLMSAYQLAKKEKKVLVIEQGKNLFDRRQNTPVDVANGIGGAGFFSDGKFSFFPSASNLWNLDLNLLKSSYEQFKYFLNQFNIEVPEFNDEWSRYEEEYKKEVVVQKHYESISVDLPTRFRMIFALYDHIGKANILTETCVKSIVKHNNYYRVNVENVNTKKEEFYNCRAIIIAGGKHSYKFLSKSFQNINTTKSFLKKEIGLRIECQMEDFDFYENQQTDVKLINKIDEFTEVRTFCCCRNGIVIASESYGFCGFNGISNDYNSTKCNIGINLRVTENSTSKLIEEVDKSISQNKKPKKVSLTDFLNENIEYFGNNIDKELREYIKNHLPNALKANGSVYLPSYEALGEYPHLNQKLQIENEFIWVTGDATGLFRGLTPALVSASYVVDDICLKLKQYETKIFDDFYIKQSTTAKMMLAFTAQSKTYFYCRDAVCEYTFNRGYLPINPFRIFDYFLSDRVERNVIRNGNNEMISRCDELWVFGPIADGVLFEIARCKQLSIPIRFFNIATRASEIKEITKNEELVFEPEVHARKITKNQLLDFIFGNIARTENPKQLNLFDF